MCLLHDAKKTIQSRCHIWRRQRGNDQFVLLENVLRRNWDRSYVKFGYYAPLKAPSSFICVWFTPTGMLFPVAGTTGCLQPVGTGPSEGKKPPQWRWSSTSQLFPFQFFNTQPIVLGKTHGGTEGQWRQLLQLGPTENHGIFHLPGVSEINHKGLPICKLNGFISWKTSRTSIRRPIL